MRPKLPWAICTPNSMSAWGISQSESGMLPSPNIFRSTSTKKKKKTTTTTKKSNQYSCSRTGEGGSRAGLAPLLLLLGCVVESLKRLRFVLL